MTGLVTKSDSNAFPDGAWNCRDSTRQKSRKITIMKIIYLVTIILSVALASCTVRDMHSGPVNIAAPTVAGRQRPEPANETIRFLEARVKVDPEDFVAFNKLASAYMQQMRETGNDVYLEMALEAAKTSITILPAENNKGGLAALAQAEFSSHRFVNARDLARRLIEIDPGKSRGYQLLGDALFELGQYNEAKAAFAEMEALAGDGAMTRVAVEQRLAKLATIYGDRAKARSHMTNALRFAQGASPGSVETVAWCKWQLGEMAMAEGDFNSAEKHLNSALDTFPGYFAATEALGHLRAALGDINGAIGNYEKAVSGTPDAASAAMLGDLYQLVGRQDDAARQYALFEQLTVTTDDNKSLHSREIAMFNANHDIKTNEACDSAINDYKTRRDIYGADVVAWACYKAGRTDEARTAMSDALRFGTKDALLFYHAGMIESGAGNKDKARDLIRLALKTNPAFDLLQSQKARAVLASI